MYQHAIRRIDISDRGALLRPEAKPNPVRFGRFASHRLGDYQWRLGGSAPPPRAAAPSLGPAATADQPAQLKRGKKRPFRKENIIFKGSLQEFNRWHERRVAAATRIQRWLRRPSEANQMDLVGWRPSAGGYGHMTYRRHWGERDPDSGEHPFEDIRPARVRQYDTPLESGEETRGFNQLQVGRHPTDADHRARMAGRPKPGGADGARYSRTTSARVNLSPLERFAVNRHLSEADAYHLWGEARGQRCTAARCMSPAELLLERRRQPSLPSPFDPHELVGHLVAHNPETTGNVEERQVAYQGRHEFWRNAMVGHGEVPQPLPEEWREDH